MISALNNQKMKKKLVFFGGGKSTAVLYQYRFLKSSGNIELGTPLKDSRKEWNIIFLQTYYSIMFISEKKRSFIFFYKL